MPITLHHLTADSTWLITFTPPPSTPTHKPFTILLDPWLEGPSAVWHPKFAINSRPTPPSITHLSQLQTKPDIVLISQTKTDHCNEATCRQLDPRGVKVYAVPGADKIVKSWRHFEEGSVRRLRKFGSRGAQRVTRIPVYKSKAERSEDGQVGEKQRPTASITSDEPESDIAAIIEIAFLPALKPWEIPSLHIALGISYTPITSSGLGETSSEILSAPTPHLLPPSPPPTPPGATKSTSTQRGSQLLSPSTISIVSSNLNLSPIPTSTTTYTSTTSRSSSFLSKSKSLSNLRATLTNTSFTSSSTTTTTTSSSSSPSSYISPPCPKTLLTETILYSPHGVPASAVTSYIASVPLPLTAIIHCFVRVTNPRWLGGTVSSGAPNAFKIVEEIHKQSQMRRGLSADDIQSSSQLSPTEERSGGEEVGVKYIVATHDEEVEMGGFCSYFVKKVGWGVGQIEGVVGEMIGVGQKEEGMPAGVKVMEAGVGELVELV